MAKKKQLPDLQNQIDTLKAKYPDHVVFSDCASGQLQSERPTIASTTRV